MSKSITLTQGKCAVVDDEDYSWLSQWKWHAVKCPTSCGDIWYAIRRGPRPRQETFYMHREILKRTGIKAFESTDHKDHNGLNNRRGNLRPCNHSQNMGNRRKSAGCSSRYKGVTWDRNKWKVTIRNGRKHTNLGRFEDEREAGEAYALAARAKFGEFACL